MSSIEKVHDMETASPTRSASCHTKGSIDIQIDRETYSIDAAAERRLVWKFDLRILPILSVSRILYTTVTQPVSDANQNTQVMYLFNALDKANLGNAKTNGLERDLGMLGTNQYNTILSIFFVPYVLTAPFLAILGKKYGPSRVLPAMMFTFGTMTVLVVTVKNFSGLFALRWFLGMAESECASAYGSR
jgi:MFS family permease